MPCRQNAAVMAQSHLPPSCPMRVLPPHEGRERLNVRAQSITPAQERLCRSSGNAHFTTLAAEKSQRLETAGLPAAGATPCQHRDSACKRRCPRKAKSLLFACLHGRSPTYGATVRYRNWFRCSRRSYGRALQVRRQSPAPQRGTSIRHCDGRVLRK